MQQQWPQLTPDIADMKRRQVAASTTESTTATTTASATEEGGLLDSLRSMVTGWLTNYSIPFL